MRDIEIDFSGLTTRGNLHDLLARELQLPDYYGRNMDALFDCLTDIHEPTHIVLTGLWENTIPLACSSMLTVFRGAEEENDNLEVEVINDEEF